MKISFHWFYCFCWVFLQFMNILFSFLIIWKILLQLFYLAHLLQLTHNNISHWKIISKIQKILINLYHFNVSVILKWIPSHSTIFRNELVDFLAKAAYNYSNITHFDFAYEKLKIIIKNKLKLYNINVWNTNNNSVFLDLS